eukprot:2333932-Alexandrium_andersonii.AAC.1
MELLDQASGLGCAQNGGAGAPQTDQGIRHRQHGNVVDEGRRGRPAGREGSNDGRAKGKAPKKGLDGPPVPTPARTGRQT